MFLFMVRVIPGVGVLSDVLELPELDPPPNPPPPDPFSLGVGTSTISTFVVVFGVVLTVVVLGDVMFSSTGGVGDAGCGVSFMAWPVGGGITSGWETASFMISMTTTQSTMT